MVNNSYTSSTQAKKGKKRFGALKILIYALYAGSGAALVWFISMNIQPYVALLTLSGSQFVSSGFVNFLLWIPLIGNILRTLGNSIVWISGFFIWLPIQLLQVLPGVLWRHHGFLSAVVKASDSSSVISIKDNDPRSIKNAKKALNNFIAGFLDNMSLYCVAAYIIDALVCIWYYPIMPGIPWERAVQYLMLGVFQYINWGNVFGTIATLFAVELIVHTMISINMLHRFLIASSKEH